MRIVLISHTDSPWAPHYARFLFERGHEVHVVSFHPKPLPDVTVHYVGTAQADGELPRWVYLARVPHVRRLLRRLRPDVVLATYTRSNGLVGALSKCSPLVVSSRGYDWQLPLPLGLDLRLARWIANRADALHASSHELAEAWDAFGVAAERFVVIPLGTDPERFRPREGARTPGPPRILCTRKHRPLYDQPTIVRALGRLRDQGLTFEARFVGEGPSRPQTEALVQRLGLDEQVAFEGDLPPESIPEQLRWADVYVSAAESDGSPSSLFEAMSTELFPVVTDVRANRDWIEHRENGWLFPFGDDAACAEGLRFAWDAREQVQEAAHRNRKTVIEKLDRQAGLQRLESLLLETAGRGARG